MEPTPPVQPLSICLPATGMPLPVAPHQTLWHALQQAGVRWPASCRNGTCRTCIGQLLAGRVRYTVAWPGLLPEEKGAGLVLPCVACAETDVVLRGPGA
jgi:ferredoxin